jgi:pyroglutamyl-peptidase
MFANRAFSIDDSGIVLITGFNPFGDYITNISGELAKDMNGAVIGRLKIIGCALAFNSSGESIGSLIETFNPIMIVATGIYPEKSRSIRIERFARSGKEYYVSTLPVEAITTELKKIGMQVIISDNAGYYECSRVFYQIMYYLFVNQIQIPAGFIHIPNKVFSLQELKCMFTTIITTIENELKKNVYQPSIWTVVQGRKGTA